MPIFLRLLGYLRPYWRSLAAGLLCLLLATPAGLFHPLVWRYVVDDVIGGRQVAMLLPALAAMIGAQMVGSLLSALRSNLLEKVGQRFVLDLRNAAYRKLQGQSIAYLHRKNPQHSSAKEATPIHRPWRNSPSTHSTASRA